MTQNYERMVEIFVKADLRDEIRTLKKVGGLTYDQFLRNLIKKDLGVNPSLKGIKKNNQSDRQEVLP